MTPLRYPHDSSRGLGWREQRIDNKQKNRCHRGCPAFGKRAAPNTGMTFRWQALRAVTLVGILLAGVPLAAADSQRLLLIAKAQADFERLDHAGAPELPDAARCEQSEAALLAIASRRELAVIHFRKGYCTLADAAIANRAEGFSEAARELELAVKAWPDRADSRKNQPPGPVPLTLRVLLSIARLRVGPDAAGLTQAYHDLVFATGQPICSGALLPTDECRSLVAAGHLWLGWIDLKREDLVGAHQDFSALPDSGWARWAAGLEAFHDRQYAEAEAQYRMALDAWMGPQITSAESLADRLAPEPDRPRALREYGGAQLVTGDLAGAMEALNAAVKAAPDPARALYLRARAEELSGQMERAMADLSLASRTAMANAQDLASGEAHLYRGILLYRRKNFAQAENEFGSALNFEIPVALRPDAVAWRYLAAVAGGACMSSRGLLEQSLAAVSPYFPKSEARAAASACPLGGSGI